MNPIGITSSEICACAMLALSNEAAPAQASAVPDNMRGIDNIPISSYGFWLLRPQLFWDWNPSADSHQVDKAP
ncbi:hypothetical protein G6F57_023805 [Rhizopus arrhizus]|nr:hypothetical protein G6F57_023805 [Rhizopus arrhizus]